MKQRSTMRLAETRTKDDEAAEATPGEEVMRILIADDSAVTRRVM